MSDPHIETERKYLIAFPDTEVLCSLKDVEIADISQTYLKRKNGNSRRVRKLTKNNKTVYIYGEKKKISQLGRIENEYEISETEAGRIIAEEALGFPAIEKRRYIIPYGEFIYEIDIYPFWDDRAIMEVELESEDIVPPVPPFAKILKDVTFDHRYKNTNLIKKVPFDNL